jgi:hypothetical protein
MFLILKNIIPEKTKKNLKKIIYIGLFLFILYFITISENRFNNSNYSYEVPSSFLIKDPVVYSYIDYLSQWYFNGAEVLHDYNFETFKGKITFSSLNELLGRFKIISYNPSDYRKLRMQLWRDNWYTFTGFPAYSIYDYGIIGAFLFCIFYFVIVTKRVPRERSISIRNLFLITLLIQIPLMAIFYSQMENLVYPLLFYFGISSYLKVRMQ